MQNSTIPSVYGVKLHQSLFFFTFRVLLCKKCPISHLGILGTWRFYKDPQPISCLLFNLNKQQPVTLQFLKYTKLRWFYSIQRGSNHWEIGYLTDSKKVTITTIPWPMMWKFFGKIQTVCPAEIYLYSLIPIWQPIFYKILFL